MDNMFTHPPSASPTVIKMFTASVELRGDPLRVVYPENWSWYASAKEAPVGGGHIVHLPSKCFLRTSLNRLLAHRELNLITPHVLPGYTHDF